MQNSANHGLNGSGPRPIKTAPLRLAVVGCGAQAEHGHLPAIVASHAITLAALVDTNTSQVRRLADKYAVPLALESYKDLAGQVDAALLVLPNFLHAPITIDLLNMGIPVLVEKPMATTSAACTQMIAAATHAAVPLAVGFDFRFLKATRFVHQAMSRGLLGKILSFDLRMGNLLPASYVLKSDYLVKREAAGGGVLIDLGVHGLDLALWWFGDYANVRYFDDSMGGVEGNSLLNVVMASGAEGTLEFSRMRTLRNSCIIRGERGTLEVGLWTSNGVLNLHLAGQEVVLTAENLAANETWHDVFRLQIDDFADAVATGREPFVPGTEGMRSVDLVEACYGVREPLPQPWMSPPARQIATRAP